MSLMEIVKDITDFNRVRDRICYRLVNKDKTAGAAYTDFAGDMVKSYFIPLAEDGEHEISAKVGFGTLKHWGVSMNTLVSIVDENTPRLFPVMFQELGDVVGQQCVGDEPPMLVLTNTRRTHGAGVICYPNVLSSVSEAYDGSDLYILPSSIHEVIVTPVANLSPKNVVNMVREINRDVVSEDEFLSDTVLKYAGGKITEVAYE